MMKVEIKPVPGMPGYYIDLATYTPYSLKSGRLKELKTKTKYKTVNVSLGHRGSAYHYGTTVYRMAYAVIHNIDAQLIPSDLCIGERDGKLRVITRAELLKESKRNYDEVMIREKWKMTERNFRMIADWYKGKTDELAAYLEKLEVDVAKNMVWIHGMAPDKARMYASMAVNKFYETLDAGKPSVYIATYVKLTARGIHKKDSLSRIRDFSKPIIIGGDGEMPDIPVVG